MGRIIIFTGKGGVGKTSVAAAHARRACLAGLNTLIVSVDMAHNLSDLFDRQIGKEITRLDDKLYALEIDPAYEMEHNFSHLMKALDNVMPIKQDNGEDKEGLSMIPGIEKLFSLLRIQQIYESDEFELIVVDCGPTGETLSLLKFPELFAWYMEKLFPIGRLAVRLLHPVSQKLFNIELPDSKAMSDIQKLYVRLYELQELLKNKDISSIRIVTMPEKMVVEETKRNYMYLNLYNFNVDAVFINRVLPKDQELYFFEEWLEIQDRYIKELEAVFYGTPIYRIKWYDTEIAGHNALDRLMEDTLNEQNILSVMKTINNEEYVKNSEGYLLKLFIPNVNKGEILLHESSTDIVIRIGNFKRSIPLPNSLKRYQVTGAKLNGDYLNVQFIKEEGMKENE